MPTMPRSPKRKHGLLGTPRGVQLDRLTALASIQNDFFSLLEQIACRL